MMALALIPAGATRGQSEADGHQADPAYPVLVTAETRTHPEALARLEQPGQLYIHYRGFRWRSAEDVKQNGSRSASTSTR